MSIRMAAAFLLAPGLTFLAHSAFAEVGPQCGASVDAEDVMVVDTEDDSPEMAEKMKIIATARMDEETWHYRNRGSRVQTIHGATTWAAKHGCDVLVIGPMTETELRTTTSGSASGVQLRKHLSLRVGVRDGDG